MAGLVKTTPQAAPQPVNAPMMRCADAPFRTET
jgi:hypothetical protein